MSTQARLDYALGEFVQYADHQSWRCAHPDRYPWWDEDGVETDCCCALLDVLRTLGLTAEADAMFGLARAEAERRATRLKEEGTASS